MQVKGQQTIDRELQTICELSTKLGTKSRLSAVLVTQFGRWSWLRVKVISELYWTIDCAQCSISSQYTITLNRTDSIINWGYTTNTGHQVMTSDGHIWVQTRDQCITTQLNKWATSESHRVSVRERLSAEPIPDEWRSPLAWLVCYSAVHSTLRMWTIVRTPHPLYYQCPPAILPNKLLATWLRPDSQPSQPSSAVLCYAQYRAGNTWNTFLLSHISEFTAFYRKRSSVAALESNKLSDSLSVSHCSHSSNISAHIRYSIYSWEVGASGHSLNRHQHFYSNIAWIRVYPISWFTEVRILIFSRYNNL